MKNVKRILCAVLAVIMVFGLFGCNRLPDPTTPPTQPQGTTPEGTQPQESQPTEVKDLLVFAQGTILRMATGYNKPNTGITFDADTAKDGITLANGKTYHAGDLKPTWEELQVRLGMVFED